MKTDGLNASVVEQQYRFLAGYISDYAIYSLDTQGIVLDWAGGAEAIYGYPASQVIGRLATQLCDPDDTEATSVAQQLEEARTQGGCETESWQLKSDGSRFRAKIVTVPLQDGGQCTGYSRLVSNLTQHDQDAEDLRLSQARARGMFASSVMGVLIGDQHGNITEANDTFLRMTGYTAEDVEHGHLNWVELTPPRFAPLDAEAARQLGETGSARAYEKEYLKKDQTLLPILIGAEMIQDQRNRCVCFIVDMTKARETQALLEQQAIELRQSNAELEQFAYIASHDLQEPLRTVRGFAQLLQRRYKNRLDQDANEYIGFITNTADRMKSMIDSLLSYSHISSLTKLFAPTDLTQVLRRALDYLQASIRQTSMTLLCDPLPTVVADSELMVHLFQNLIGNAIKFRSPDRPLHIEISVSEEPQQWEFRIKDNGIGMDMAYAGRIFGVFGRLHGLYEYEGTGIGLAICKKIVERHGGTIRAESESDKGATFIFTLKKT